MSQAPSVCRDGFADHRARRRDRSPLHSHVLDNAEPVHIDIICQAAGLTTAAYSFGYVATWSGGNPNTVKATAERVTACARTILDRTGLLEPSDEQEAV